MKRIFRYLPLLFCISFAHAQSAVDVNLGFGTNHAKASGSGIDQNTGLACTTGSTCLLSPALSGFFLGFGGGVMIDKHFGFGAEAVLQPAKQDYAGLQARQTFYDVNAIYAPGQREEGRPSVRGRNRRRQDQFFHHSKFVRGHRGLLRVPSQPVGNSSHFLVHAGVGVQLFCDRAHLHPSAVRPALHSQLHHSVRQQRRSGRNDLDRLQSRRSIVLWDRPSPRVVCHSSLKHLKGSKNRGARTPACRVESHSTPLAPWAASA